ncbi:SGNH/GDSL hydrolase family protein [Leptospira sp. WS92.C1]
MKTKILLLTDSLGLPRPNTPEIKDSDVWTYLVAEKLKNEYLFFFQRIGGLHTRELISQSQFGYLAGYSPDIIILQIGIVDCTPRSVREKELKLFQFLPEKISNKIHQYVKKNHIKLIYKRKIKYVYPAEFEANLNQFKSIFENARIFAIAISGPNDSLSKNNPYLVDAVDLYNEILKKLFGSSFINPYSRHDLDANLLEDGIHLSRRGHLVVANAVEKVLAFRKTNSTKNIKKK